MSRRIKSTKFSQVRLAQALHKKTTRDQEGLFIIEGIKELELAINNGVRLHSLFIHEDPPQNDKSGAVFLDASDRVRDECTFIVTDRVFRSLSYRSNSGFVAIAYKHDLPLAEFEIPENPLLVICSGLEKPGNLGAIMRSADAVGAHAVIIDSPVLDVFNPNVVRASIGTLFSVPVVLSDFEVLASWLQAHNVSVITTSPNAHADYAEYAYPNRVAIVVGNETLGLEQCWFQFAQTTVSIPQYGQADSLNAAMSATVVMYEVLRQRN